MSIRHFHFLGQFPSVCISLSKGAGGHQKELAVAQVHIGEAMVLQPLNKPEWCVNYTFDIRSFTSTDRVDGNFKSTLAIRL
jgi:hypothetical protein